MNSQPTRPETVKSLFLETLGISKSERAAFLERACGGDGELRSEVDRLIREHEETPTATQLIDPYPQPPPRTLAGGEVLAGRFRILRFVGHGGMGEVYQAADLELRGVVALKTLRPNLLSDPQSLDRFRREVQLARQVTHPNVCRIFDVGRHTAPQANDVTFLTMEFLDGDTLARILVRDGRMNPEAALPFVRQIAGGLSALHERGVIHRDLKPGNIMIVQPAGSSAMRAVITDFGLALAIQGESLAEPVTLTGNNHILGTPEYMAPEQLLGEPPSPASDIYAFGLVIYEMVTARRAFARGAANLSQRINEEPVSPCRHAPELSKTWERVILRCLAKAPEERPSSAAAVVSELLEGSSASSVVRTARRVWMAGAMMLSLILFAAWFALTRPGFRPPPRQHVAVLNFNVPADDPSLRMFADGLMESITGRLSQYEGPKTKLLVVPASEVRRQSAKTPSDAKDKFGANEVVEGSIQTQGDRVRLQLTLVDTGQLSQIETVVVEDLRANAFNLQDAAVERLAGALKVHVRPEYAQEARHLAPLAPGAYEYYLQARGYLQRNDQAQSLESAATLLDRAIAMDPKFALAHSGRAQTYFYQFKLTRDPKLVDAALAAGKRALALNPGLPESNIAMGQIFYGTGRNQEARQSFQRAIDGDGRNNEAWQGLAAAYLGLKDYAQAEATYRKAIAMRPEDWNGYKALGLFYYEREDYARAAGQFQKVVELTPDNAQGFLNLGAAEAGRENWDAAEKAWLRALLLDPKRAGTLSNLGKIYLDRGQNGRAIEMYLRSLDLNTRSYPVWGQLAKAYQRIGEREKANDALTRALEAVDAELAVNPARFNAWAAQAFYRAQMGRKDYEAPLARSLELAPDNGDILERAAETYAVAGDRRRAAEALAKALTKGVSMKSVERSEYLKDVRPVVETRK